MWKELRKKTYILHTKIMHRFELDTGPDTTDSIVETSSTLD